MSFQQKQLFQSRARLKGFPGPEGHPSGYSTVLIGLEKVGLIVQISSLFARLGKYYFYTLFTRLVPVGVTTI